MQYSEFLVEDELSSAEIFVLFSSAVKGERFHILTKLGELSHPVTSASLAIYYWYNSYNFVSATVRV